MNKITAEEIRAMTKGLPPEEMLRILELVEELEQRKFTKLCAESLPAFVIAMQPDYKMGSHLKRLYSLLEDLEAGAKDRIVVNMAPRFGKSQSISIYFPAWYLGRHPDHKLIIASHTADLAVDMLRKVRNLMQTDEYKRIFPGVNIASDAKASGKWNTTKGGEAYAVGVGGALAGRGAHILIVDDPFSEQDIINGNYAVFDKVYEWFAYGARPRLMPGGRVAVLHTRWSQKDLTARLIKDGQLNPQSDQYELFEFPALLNEGEENQKSLWPEQWSLEALLRTKASMPTFQWNAQYQQNPTNADGGIVTKEWFRTWEKVNPPQCEFVLMSLDAAVEAKQRSDFNALQTWGVFMDEDAGRYELILLNSVAFRAEFPELKDKCLEEYKFWQPDTFIIEAKANGAPLLQEFRRMGMVLQSFTPHRGTGDKTARLNAVADIVRDGLVWVPQTRWAEELVDNVTTFPAADHDDITDSFVLAMMRFRSGGFISLSSDEPDDDDAYESRPPAAYY